MPRSEAYLQDILNAARLATRYLSGMEEAQFLDDIQTQDSVVRRLEIIGEAARRVPDDFRAAHPELPWESMVQMRNVMIHQYDDVDPAIVWDTVRQDLPPLIALLEEILGR